MADARNKIEQLPRLFTTTEIDPAFQYYTLKFRAIKFLNNKTSEIEY